MRWGMKESGGDGSGWGGAGCAVSVAREASEDQHHLIGGESQAGRRAERRGLRFTARLRRARWSGLPAFGHPRSRWCRAESCDTASDRGARETMSRGTVPAASIAHGNRVPWHRLSDQSLRWRILLRLRRFLRPSFRRPLPVFLVPMNSESPAVSIGCGQMMVERRAKTPRHAGPFTVSTAGDSFNGSAGSIRGERVYSRCEADERCGHPPGTGSVVRTTVTGSRNPRDLGSWQPSDMVPAAAPVGRASRPVCVRPADEMAYMRDQEPRPPGYTPPTVSPVRRQPVVQQTGREARPTSVSCDAVRGDRGTRGRRVRSRGRPGGAIRSGDIGG